MIFDFDNWKEIGATLARNKTRTFLTAFGIFWGTAMLALLWGGSQGFKRLLQSNFEGFASNSAIVVAAPTTMPYKGYQKGMTWAMTLDDVDNVRRIAPEFATVSPTSSKSVTIKHADKTTTSQMQGIEPAFTDVYNPIVLQGRFINDIDLAKSAKVCVLGEDAAASIFGVDNPLGQFVEADNVFFQVVGVIRQRSDVSVNGRISESMLVPLTTAMRLDNRGNKVDMLTLIALPGYKPADLKPKLMRAFRLSHPLSPDDENCMWFFDISEQFENIENIFLGVELLILFVGLSSLIAGVIGVGNIMWIIVKERTKEFGIRRAIGAKPSTVLTQILSESAILTCIAGIAGICFAVGILAVATPIIQHSSGVDVDFQLSFRSAVTVMVLFLTLGSAAGSIPAFKAMKIKPIEALNDK